MNKLYKAAFEYANKGIKIVPVAPKGKRAFKTEDFHTPTVSLDIIKEWWDYCPVANIGVPTSLKYNGLIIIDVDIKNGIDGYASLNRILQENNLKIPQTSIVKTGSGGMHYYYRNINKIMVNSSNGTKLGIDIRADRAHVVAPPSVHKSGNTYEWMTGNIDSIANATEDVIKLVEIVNAENKKEYDEI